MTDVKPVHELAAEHGIKMVECHIHLGGLISEKTCIARQTRPVAGLFGGIKAELDPQCAGCKTGKAVMARNGLKPKNRKEPSQISQVCSYCGRHETGREAVEANFSPNPKMANGFNSICKPCRSKHAVAKRAAKAAENRLLGYRHEWLYRK